MRICCATSGLSSMLSLTIRTAPLAARTAFSSSGPNCLHGPHHGAQKSTITGCSNEASTTSAIKVAVVTSWTETSAPAAPLPPPINCSSAIPASRWKVPTTWPHAAAMTSVAGASTRRRCNLDDARSVAAGFEKTHEAGGRHRRRAVVFERVVVERFAREHRALQHHCDAARAIVDRGERGDAARPHAQRLAEELGRAEREARRAQAVGQRLQVDAAFLERDDEPQPAFPVLEEKALAMPARQRAAQRLRLLHGENRRLVVGAVRDAQHVEPGEEFVGRERRYRERRRSIA